MVGSASWIWYRCRTSGNHAAACTATQTASAIGDAYFSGRYTAKETGAGLADHQRFG